MIILPGLILFIQKENLSFGGKFKLETPLVVESIFPPMLMNQFNQHLVSS